ncbi:hypothetical protein CHARACLAT_028362 [Characodon lateralis]|uniref:Uncharacterized protein n=1 Tax=Characodon lateralis TaxID=208331 RepID=A0ABU7CU42_9TELE|nr:hypothetical protein [Characodon lateralis]
MLMSSFDAQALCSDHAMPVSPARPLFCSCCQDSDVIFSCSDPPPPKEKVRERERDWTGVTTGPSASSTPGDRLNMR